jgi:hypothetical protein
MSRLLGAAGRGLTTKSRSEEAIMIRDSETFWMVKGNGPTSFVHDSPQSAADEAKRLARENPGKQFYVLQAMKGYVTNDLVEFDLSYIPF